jgi:signal transduction histidine kinase/ActR/RegA family two-component response regulator
LVYEPDIRQVDRPFSRRLAGGGLRSVVIAPLQFESKVFGVLLVGRRQPEDFNSSDCEFVRQLSAHIGLAAHQAQMYNALQDAYEDLRQTQQTVMHQERLRALGQMASGIAHDINNALSPVALYTESLLEREPGLSTRTRKYLETTQRALDDVAHTVARMAEFYRQREPALVLAPVQINSLIPQVMELTRARWSDMPQQRGVVIQTGLDLAPDLPAVAGVESEIREALVNLIFNAVDALPEGGTLTLRTRASHGSSPSGPGRLVYVEVVDSGIGMNEETRRRCLEPFFTTKGERGTGLGLAMVFGVAQRNGADVEVESAVGEGTTVRLVFPMAVSPKETEIPRVYATLARLKILLIDDDPLMIKSMRDTLEADGHVVVSANGGQEGIDVFRAAEGGAQRFALVFTDLGMPRVDGRQVARAVKSTRASAPVIMLTGWGHRLVAEGDMPPHVDRVLNKPPKLRELRAALGDLTASLDPQ